MNTKSNVVSFTRYLDVTGLSLVKVRDMIKALGWKSFKINWKLSGDDKAIIERLPG